MNNKKKKVQQMNDSNESKEHFSNYKNGILSMLRGSSVEHLQLTNSHYRELTPR